MWLNLLMHDHYSEPKKNPKPGLKKEHIIKGQKLGPEQEPSRGLAK